MADSWVLATEGGGEQLLTYHPTAIRSSSRWFHDAEWLNFNMMQTGTTWDLDNYALVQKDYHRAPVKPVIDGEARYENSYELFSRPPTGRRISAHQVRKAAYNAFLSGAMGHTYGCRDVWFFYDPKKGTGGRDVSIAWKQALNLPGAWQLGYLRKLLTDCPWYRLTPAVEKRLVLHGCSPRSLSATYTPAAMDQDKSFALVYIPERMPIYVDRTVFGSRSFKACWFDPATGYYSDWQTHAAEHRHFDFTQRSAAEDHVLLLVKEDSSGSQDPIG